MKRTTPIPEVSISTNIFTDEDTGENIASIIIDVKIEDASNGFIVLDEPGDLFILRNAIDHYITSHKLVNPFL